MYIAKELSERKVRVAVRRYPTLRNRRDARNDGDDNDDDDENFEPYSLRLILE